MLHLIPQTRDFRLILSLFDLIVLTASETYEQSHMCISRWNHTHHVNVRLLNGKKLISFFKKFPNKHAFRLMHRFYGPVYGTGCPFHISRQQINITMVKLL